VWPFRKPWTFDEGVFNAWLLTYRADTEARLKDAADLYWEIKSWPTPVEAWQKLWIVPEPPPKPKPYVDAWANAYTQTMSGSYQVHTSTYSGGVFTHSGLAQTDLLSNKLPTLPTYNGKPGFCLQLRPGEPFEVGSIIRRGETRYQITQRLFDNTNRVMAKQVRWRP
jgi:hypothetical protein